MALLMILAFFVVFHVKALQAHFGADEMRNLYGYWEPPAWKAAMASLAFWSKFVRPMGALYYLPLYGFFGLNPGPYNIVRLGLLLLNTALFFGLARYLGRSWWIATLATFPIAYQANLGNLAYDGAFIYDVLCGGFYFGALLYYVRCRRVGSLGVGQVCIFLALYICALDSKEMAVSLPVLVLAYELLFEGRLAKLRPALLAIAVAVVFVVGKTSGEGSLTAFDAYRPVLSWARFSESSTRFLNTIFYTDLFTMRRVLELWAVLLYVGLRRWGSRGWDPRWLFFWIWVTVTPLPIAFLTGRGAATLYIVSGGWAMLAAMALRTLCARLAREPALAYLNRNTAMAAGLLACILAYTHETWRVDQRVTGGYLVNGESTRRVIDQVSTLSIRPARHSRIVFLNDPFPDRYDTLFIAALLWRDPSLEINLQQRYTLPEPEVAKSDYIVDYIDGNFVLRKPARQ
jgi:hypothetical protein